MIQYEGTRYQGWQRQISTENTIQGKLEHILTKMVNKKVEIQASGRTDAGVHAYGQVISFHADTEMGEEEILRYMNRYLPEDIGVLSVERVPDRFHARLNAGAKTYRYRVLNSDLPHIFDRRYVYQLPEPLDMERIRAGAALLVGVHDFRGFTPKKNTKKSTCREIYDISVERVGEEWQFTFRGNGFLYHMVRIMMGTLLEIGLHQREVSSVTEIFETGDRALAGFLAPAQGLALMKVEYHRQ
ncbi:MAG: tRNA pseudouridine(38-40) synthase TruA [Lachnospiraceae bacterium]|nr:tRNA pseudouridine(38-40) synthase TruA [Lachnospiraceae bacterium]